MFEEIRTNSLRVKSVIENTKVSYNIIDRNYFQRRVDESDFSSPFATPPDETDRFEEPCWEKNRESSTHKLEVRTKISQKEVFRAFVKKKDPSSFLILHS